MNRSFFGSPILSSPADEHRRDIIRIYLALRALFIIVSLLVISITPGQLAQNLPLEGRKQLWFAWILFTGWSVPVARVCWSALRKDLALTDWLVSLSLIPDSLALFLAASVTGGPAGATYRSVYFLIAIHSYYFSPDSWTAESRSPHVRLLRLSGAGAATVLCGMSIFCALTLPGTPFVQYFLECGLQVLIATAFLLVRFSNLKRVQMLAQTQDELERVKETEGNLLEAMQDVSTIARISDERQLDKKIRHLIREIGQNFESEYCVLGLVRGNKLQVIARYASFKLSSIAKSVLGELTTRPLGAGLVGSVLRSRQPFRWNSEDGRDFVDLDQDELIALGLSIDIAGTLRLRDEVLPSRSIRNVLAAPFYSQDSEERPLGYILLLNKISEGFQNKDFSPLDQDRLGTIVTQAAVAITNFEHHVRHVARAEREGFFNSLILTEDLDDLFNRILSYLNREYSSRVASLWLATEDGFEGKLHVVLRSVIVGEQSNPPVSKKELEERLKQLKIFRLSECFIGKFFSDKENFPEITYVEDLRTVTDSWASCLKQVGTRHLIAIPIWRYPATGDLNSVALSRSNNKISGVVCLRPLHSFSMTSERREDFERLAAYLAVLIDQVRFRRRYRQIEILKNHLHELQTTDLGEFYSRVVGLVRDAIDSEVCSLFTVDADGALILKATTAEKAISVVGNIRTELLTKDYIGKIVYPAGEDSNTSKIAEMRRTILLYDVHRSAFMSTRFMEVTSAPEHESLIGTPIVHTDGTLMGVLRCINRSKAGALLPVFVQEDKEFLDLIVGIMARFIENAEASASKRDFLAQLAHELASPLGSLRNQIDFLEDVTRRGRYVRDPEKQFAYLREQAEFIQFLVGDIQYQFGKGAAITVRYDFSVAVDLARIIERIKMLLLPTARMDRQVDIITGTSLMPPLFVDPRRMEQVIFNLLQNAVKYSRRGGGDIFLGYDLVEEVNSTGTLSKWHRISFKDWGVGIQEVDLPFIFEEYRRGTNIEGAPSGTGLGLAVAKRIVEVHGGRVSVAHAGNPTIVAVELPEELARRPPGNANFGD